MLKYIILVIVILTISTVVSAQVYSILSFDDNPQKINISVSDENLKISYLKDTIYIRDFTGFTQNVNTFNKNFLKIVYSVRAGSGLHDERTLLLCVNKQTLYQAIHITSVFKEEFIDFSEDVNPADPIAMKSIYNINFGLIGNDNQSYKLNLKIHDERQFKKEPKTNYNNNANVVLNFDHQQNIFYNTYEDVSQYFTIFDFKTGQDTKQYIFGKFPAIKLGTYEYYFIKGIWCEKNAYNDLIKYSYK